MHLRTRTLAAAATALLLSCAFCLRAQSAPDGDGPQRGGSGGGRRGGGVRGTVTGVSGSSVLLKTDEGVSWTVISTDNTRVRRDGQPGSVSAVQPGDEVMAMGIPDAEKHELHAMMMMDVSAAEVAKAKANLGKTYIVGRVTAINETQLTILRTDKVSQTILLDESTSLHRGGRIDPAALSAAGLDEGMMGMGGGGGGRGGNGPGPRAGAPPVQGGESITLADVKVGDTVMGTGGIKGNMFVPTDLRVQDRNGGPRRSGADGPPPAQ